MTLKRFNFSWNTGRGTHSSDLLAPSRSWRELARSPAAVAVVISLIALWLMAVLGRVFWNGYVYDLAYPLWYPDGVNYSYRAFIAAGVEPAIATEWLNDMYAERESPIPAGVPRTEETVNSRVMFVILSAPFVKLFGVYGLLVAPSLGLLTAALVPAIMLIRRGVFLGALLGSGLLLASTSMLRWSVANLTEGVLIGLFALLLPLLPWCGRRVPKSHLLGLAVLAVAISLTRQTLPMLIALTGFPLIALWLRQRRPPWEWIWASAAISMPAAAVFLATFPRSSFYLLPYAQDAGGKEGLAASGRIVNLFVDLFRLTAIEIGQLAVLDRALLILLGLSLFLLVRSPLNTLAASWLGVAFSGAFLTAWVGAAGVNFRYSMPLAMVSALAFANLNNPKDTKETALASSSSEAQ